MWFLGKTLHTCGSHTSLTSGALATNAVERTEVHVDTSATHAYSANTFLVVWTCAHFLQVEIPKRQIQQTLASGGNLVHANVQFPLTEHSAISGVSTTDVVSFSEGGRSILGTGGSASTRRRDARTALFGPSVVKISSGVSNMNRIAQRMAQLQRHKLQIRIPVFNELTKNISEEIETRLIKLQFARQPDAKRR